MWRTSPTPGSAPHVSPPTSHFAFEKHASMFVRTCLMHETYAALDPTLRPARHTYVHMQNPRCTLSWRNKPRRIESNHLPRRPRASAPRARGQGPGQCVHTCTVRENLAVHTHPYHPSTRNAPRTNRANSRARIQDAGMQVQWAKRRPCMRPGKRTRQVSSPQLTPDGLDRVGRLRSQMRDRDRG